MSADDVASKLPEVLRASYSDARKGSAVTESLKVAAVLKLWVDRGYREMGFEVPSDLGGKTFYIDVLAKNDEGMVGVECASSAHFGRLRRRVEQLRRSLPSDSWLVLVFPSNVGELVEKAVELVDEVWVTGKEGKVARMMFTSVFQKG